MAGTTASTNAPSHTHFNASSDEEDETPTDVEYPDELL